MKIEFFTNKKNLECVSITDENNPLQKFEECIEAESPNGLYKVAAGYWYVDNEKADNDGDEIEDSATLYVFSKNQITYQIKGIDYIDDEECFLFDDGRLIMFDDEQTLTMYSNLGKPTKKKVIEYYDYKICNDFAWFYGDSESGKTRVQIINLDTFSSWTKSLKEEVCSVKNVIRSDDGGFIVIAETYDATEKAYKYTSEGKVSEETLSDRNKIKVEREKNIENKKTNDIYSNTNINDNDSKKKPNIKLILIIAAIIIVLAIIGATQQ